MGTTSCSENKCTTERIILLELAIFYYNGHNFEYLGNTSFENPTDNPQELFIGDFASFITLFCLNELSVSRNF